MANIYVKLSLQLLVEAQDNFKNRITVNQYKTTPHHRVNERAKRFLKVNLNYISRVGGVPIFSRTLCFFPWITKCDSDNDHMMPNPSIEKIFLRIITLGSASGQYVAQNTLKWSKFDWIYRDVILIKINSRRYNQLIV